MEDRVLESLRYPIGRFKPPSTIRAEQVREWIEKLAEYPDRLSAIVLPLNERQLATPYRPEGWTVRQLVHHIADSHHNSYIRFKWALTESNPLIKPYDEKEWAKLIDSKSAPISLSLNHLKAVHDKLVFLLRNINHDLLKRTFVHPDGNEVSSLEENIGRYVWHGNHHYAHISNLIRREGWER